MSLDWGYIFDLEVYIDYVRLGKIYWLVIDVDVVNSGWLVVGKDDIDNFKLGFSCLGFLFLIN